MRLFFFLSIPLFVACQSAEHPALSNNDVFQTCSSLAREFRHRVNREEAANAAFIAMDAAPFLHGSRFYDALAHDVRNDFQAQELLSAMARLGDAIRRSENDSLSNPASTETLNRLSQCSFTLSNGIGQEDTRLSLIEHLKASPVVRDHYISSAQWLGFLPLLRPFLQWRIAVLHEEEKALFSAEEHFVASNSYALTESNTTNRDIPDFNQAYQDSPLAVPNFSETELRSLFETFAPRLSIEFQGEQDRLGTPRFDNGKSIIDTSTVSAYYLPSFTRFGGKNLLQLNYIFWFPSREPRNLIDLYSGEVDSLIWRVTFDDRGDVLLYDSIHSCGCYHKYFLASDNVAIKSHATSREPANIFDVSQLTHDSGLKITVSSNEHYIVGVDNEPVAQFQPYQLAPYSNLYKLESAAGRRSFFDDDGIIRGSERLERLTLWPTGIANVGAMRQWGTHATGFIARQHFDDAYLFDKYFSLED